WSAWRSRVTARSRAEPHVVQRRRGVVMQRLFTTRIYPAMTAFASTPFRAVVIVSAILHVIGWLMGYLRQLDAVLGVELPAWVQIPGIVTVVADAALALTCGAMLSTRGIGTLGGEEWFMPREFVATGPFRFVRNPMSVGALVLLIGMALWHRSAFGL